MPVVTRSMAAKALNNSSNSSISAISQKPEVNSVRDILPRRKCTYNITETLKLTSTKNSVKIAPEVNAPKPVESFKPARTITCPIQIRSEIVEMFRNKMKRTPEILVIGKCRYDIDAIVKSIEKMEL
jgi:hypothetical protein